MGPQGDFFWAFEKEGAENGCEQKEKVAQAAQARFFFASVRFINMGLALPGPPLLPGSPRGLFPGFRERGGGKMDAS